MEAASEDSLLDKVAAVEEAEKQQQPETADWQARCIELELALQKFRDQAHNIRKLLRDKVRWKKNHLTVLQDVIRVHKKGHFKVFFAR